MAQTTAPNEPQRNYQFTDRDGNLTQYGMQTLQQMWKQGVAGFVNVPCDVSGTANAIVLTPQLHSNGGETLGDGMVFSGIVQFTSTGPVTVQVQVNPAKIASADGGLTQADSGDVVQYTLVHFHYVAGLDGGAGGFVLK